VVSLAGMLTRPSPSGSDARIEINHEIAHASRRRLHRLPGASMSTWASGVGSAGRPPLVRRRLGSILLLALVVGLVGVPAATPSVQGDELADARARQEQLKKDVAAQKAQIAKLNELQSSLAAEIRETTSTLRGIDADLEAVKVKITGMQSNIEAVEAEYRALILELQGLDAKLLLVEVQERAKTVQLRQRKDLLADHLRTAYDTDRTSALEIVLSGATFTDLLSELSYLIDVGEQDKDLAVQIAKDQETLAALHQTVEDTRTRTEDLRVATAAEKVELDRSLAELKVARSDLKELEEATADALAEQTARYRAIARNKANAARIIAKAAADQKRLARVIDALIEEQIERGNIPSDFNGSLLWPMETGHIVAEYGCSSFSWYAPGNGCEHFHNGIDIVGPAGDPVLASAAGVVVYVGWNWADGSDPAWIVIIAHSGSLRTWYAHLLPKRPVEIGDTVEAGEIIGYEGSTGNSTGAHLHWMVELDGAILNPRLFI
jgi:murein DD-endopeptidase MepM/ murein hydrolase activator NlpD